MRLVQIACYPVKSLQGETVSSADIERDGVRGDRPWGIRDETTGKILTGRRAPHLLFAAAALASDGSPRITLPTGVTYHGPGSETDAALSDWLGKPVRLVSSLDAHAGRAENVAQRLGEAIRLGLILDGERLPPEVELSEQLGIATVTLREALASLREQGLIVTRRGRRGGTFVRSPQIELPDSPPLRLLDFSAHDIRELGDHRAAISGMAAQLAAQRALPDEIANLYRQVERLRAASTANHRRRADTQFTIEVAAAAQSSRLAREELALRAEVGDLLWLERSDADHEESVRLRTELVDAIGRSDPQCSRQLAEEHVAADTRRLLATRLELDDPRRDAERLRRSR